MNNAALTHALESDLIEPLRTPCLRVVSAAASPGTSRVPAAPSVPPRGLLQSLWLRLFGPRAPIDPQASASNFAVFRALHEVGSDYLPSSGTWPSSPSLE